MSYNVEVYEKLRQLGVDHKTSLALADDESPLALKATDED